MLGSVGGNSQPTSKWSVWAISGSGSGELLGLVSLTGWVDSPNLKPLTLKGPKNGVVKFFFFKLKKKCELGVYFFFSILKIPKILIGVVVVYYKFYYIGSTN